MQKIINKGFTLIELLVVIAIIGILAAIVLVSLGNARSKGADAGIQGNLDSIRTQAEVYSSNNSNSYDPTGTTATAGVNAACGTTGIWSDPTIIQAVKNANNNAGTATLNGVAAQTTVCKSSANAWMLAMVKKSDITTTWCVDSVGKAKDVAVILLDTAAEITAITACP
ncbi:prepilin-type N-terminal cleavage/methylation domain-containing protein [Candidatus Kaiserbacteria bacterium]|nr:prepilin-type N-terminal cleavage/methylation domain-containing protein [Candidatus Kaiserbacteria bacterium]